MVMRTCICAQVNMYRQFYLGVYVSSSLCASSTSRWDTRSTRIRYQILTESANVSITENLVISNIVHERVLNVG